MDHKLTVGVEGDGMNRLPIAGVAAPARRVSGPRLFVEGVTSVEDRGVVAGMTFGRCHEADPAVAMLVLYQRTKACTQSRAAGRAAKPFTG
jgi:hypothetical protein